MSTLYGDMYGEKKKAAAMKFAGFAGVAAVLAGGCFAAYSFSDTVKNQVKLAFSKPDDYFAWVCEKNTNDLAEIIGGSYQKAIGEQENGRAASVSLTYEPSAACKDFLLDDAGLDHPRGSDEQEAADILKNVQSISVSADAFVKENAVAENASLQLNGTDIFSVESAFDLDQSTAFVRIPELKEQWIGAELNGLFEEYLGSQQVSKRLSELPDGAAVAETVRKYGNLLTENISDVSVERSVPVKISNLTVNYTQITAPMTTDQMLDTVQSLIDNVTVDETLRSIIPYSYSDIMLDAGDSLRDLRTLISGNDNQQVELKLYVDPTGTIRGYDVAVSDDAEFFSAIGMDGDRLGAEMRVFAASTEIFNIHADATRHGETFNGQAVAEVTPLGSSYDKHTANLSFTNVHLIDKENCYLNGDFTIETNEIGHITLSFSSDGSSQEVTIPLQIMSKDFGKVRMRIAARDAMEFTLPNRSDAYMIDVNRAGFQLMSYADNQTLAKFCTETMKKLGFTDQTAEKIGSQIAD